MTTHPKPLLLLDVDGPLNPWRLITKRGHTAGEGYTRHEFTDLPDFPAGLPVLLSTAHGDRLNALRDRFTLIWATTWEDDANRLLSPLLGLPNLPVIYWPAGARDFPASLRHRGSWKTPHIARWLDNYAPGLAWAWVDDEINRYDRSWFDNHYENHPKPVPHLLLRVEPHVGLTDSDFDRLAGFASQPR